MTKQILVALIATSILAAACTTDDSESDNSAAGQICTNLDSLQNEDIPDAERTSIELTKPPTVSESPEIPRLLLFTRTEGFHHDSIEQAKEFFAVQDSEGVFEVTATDETGVFTEEGLSNFDAVVFANTTGDVLDPKQQTAFENWIEAGGGYAGVHSAADTEHDWPWYGDMVGAFFESHPFLLQDATITVEDPENPTTAHMPAEFDYVEEHYNYDRHPRQTANVLLTLDESTAEFITGGLVGEEFKHGPDHPIAWTKETGLGRSFYTNLGHSGSTWEDPMFQEHLIEGIRSTIDPGRWRRTVITDDIGQAVGLRVAESGLVFWIERSGGVRVWDPQSGEVHVVGEIPTEVVGEGGLIGIELAPDLAETGSIYLYWTRALEASPDGADPAEADETAETTVNVENVLQRLTLDEKCRIDSDEAVDLLTVPNDGPSHQAGELRFHPDGSLLVATGDNTENISDGYAPMDNRVGEETRDARRTSGDAMDLRGAILRVDPDGAGVEGNLDSTSTEAAPEIYISGVRNPYRISIEPDTGALWWGEIGPDAASDGDRGPRGFDEINRVTAPADGGWPYCIADTGYKEYDFNTEIVGEDYDCFWDVEPRKFYDYTTFSDPALGTSVLPPIGDHELQVQGRSIMAGPYLSGDDGKYAPPHEGLLLHEFSRNMILAADMGDEGEILGLQRIAPWTGINTPIDVEIGPDGALYVLEYGVWSGPSEGVPSLTRLEYSPDGTFPVFPATTNVAPDGEMASASELYQLHCAACHGVSGEGDEGPSFSGVTDRLSEQEHQDLVAEGRDQMPAFGDRLTPDEIATIVAHEREEFSD